MVSGGPMAVTTDRADRSTDSPALGTEPEASSPALDDWARSVRCARAVPLSGAGAVLDDSAAPLSWGVPALSSCMPALFDDSGAALSSWPAAFDGWARSERSTGAALSFCLPAGESAVVVGAAWGSSSGRDPLLPQTFIPLSLSIRQVLGMVPQAWVMVLPTGRWLVGRIPLAALGPPLDLFILHIRRLFWVLPVPNQSAIQKPRDGVAQAIVPDGRCVDRGWIGAGASLRNTPSVLLTLDSCLTHRHHGLPDV